MSDYTVERCVCPTGFGADNDWYHIPNCAKPDNAGMYLLIAMCVMNIPIFLIFMYFIKYQLKQTARTIGILAACQLWLFIALQVGLYTQNGQYEASSITMSLLISMCSFSARLIVLSAIQPVSRLSKSVSLTKYTKLYNALFAVMIVGFLAVGIPPAVFAREEDPYQTYNYLTCLATGFYWGAAIILLIGVVFVTSKLKKIVLGVRRDLGDHKIADSNDEYESILFRINILHLGAICICIPFAVMSVVIPVFMTMWGSVPFAYVIYFVQLASGAVLFTVAVFMFAKPGGVKKATDPTEKNRTTLKSSGLRSRAVSRRARKAPGASNAEPTEEPTNKVLSGSVQ
jgi:hypothetical protein